MWTATFKLQLYLTTVYNYYLFPLLEIPKGFSHVCCLAFVAFQLHIYIRILKVKLIGSSAYSWCCTYVWTISWFLDWCTTDRFDLELFVFAMALFVDHVLDYGNEEVKISWLSRLAEQTSWLNRQVGYASYKFGSRNWAIPFTGQVGGDRATLPGEEATAWRSRAPFT